MKIQSQEYAQSIVGQVLAGARVSKAVKPTHDGKQHGKTTFHRVPTHDGTSNIFY